MVSGKPNSFEGQIVKIADGIAYINHDLDDALRARMLALSDIPHIVPDRLGATHGQRIDTLVRDVVDHNRSHVASETPSGYDISLSRDILAGANALRDFLFERVYAPINELPTTQHAEAIVMQLFLHYTSHPASLPDGVPRHCDESIERHVADVVSSMTDRFAIDCYERLFRPLAEEL
jgi:dGTPase